MDPLWLRVCQHPKLRPLQVRDIGVVASNLAIALIDHIRPVGDVTEEIRLAHESLAAASEQSLTGKISKVGRAAFCRGLGTLRAAVDTPALYQAGAPDILVANVALQAALLRAEEQLTRVRGPIIVAFGAALVVGLTFVFLYGFTESRPRR